MVAYQQPHVNKQELWMRPCELYELEGTLYNEICIVLAGSWLKAICTMRPCNRTLPFNLQYLCIHTTVESHCHLHTWKLLVESPFRLLWGQWITT
jgi:hypothetical protein